MGGMVLFLERCMGGMVFFLERRRVDGRVLESSRDVRGCVISFVMRLSGFVNSRDVNLI